MMADNDSNAHELVDEWAPQGLDWEHLVREYPVPSLAAVAVGGFLLGRHHGPEILTAFAAYAGRQLEQMVQQETQREAVT